MQYRQLGRSGLRVSTLILGTMSFGGKGMFGMVADNGVAEARRQIDMLLDAGVNMVDTADIYSMGESERIVGEALKGKRDQVLIASKVRSPVGEGPNEGGLSRHHIKRGCEASLKRLGTDHLDLYWAHEWDGATPLEETLRAFEDLRTEGKINYFGISNWAGWHLMKALGISEREGLIRPVAQQIYYSLQSREAEYELMPISVDQDVSIVAWSPLAAGLLGGKFTRDNPRPEGTRQVAGWPEPPMRDWEALWRIVDELTAIANERKATPAQVALAWLLTRPGVAALVIGARNEVQLSENLVAADITLSPEEVRRLEEVSRPPLLYPYWHQKANATERLSAADHALLDQHPKPY
ncbi:MULTISPECIES: aldo/keto reductase [unclassified Sphingomonas]|uniref:aldo/keto reductase n=1 Tax=unclassified Sphingomonas TaxID=196159 RepID=UPI0006FAD7A6|nr:MULTISPECIES: aldo/keto reductase [unclassified Sphingomonas]KQM59838.1 aldo/keto reductase [Sphingomonas sp. Leaf16]KQN11236.1 aldo/keto reductase [Sphingomonas sp. Leaf29]KQN18557.1 aldo/keto reductase [Sphingomonas sp. Leaf32]